MVSNHFMVSFLTAALFATVFATKDVLCKERDGECYDRAKLESGTCSDGIFVKGLCSGGASRQCCLSSECTLDASTREELYEVELYILNTGKESSKLYWLNSEGEEEYFITIDSGNHYQVYTYPEHKWIARDNETDELLRIDGRCWFPSPYLTPTAVVITDTSYDQDTFCTVRGGTCYDRANMESDTCSDGIFVKGLCSGGASHHCCLSSECILEESTQGMLYEVELYILNTRSESSKLFWLDWEGKEQYFTTMEPGHNYKVYTYPEHNWIARDSETNELLWIDGRCWFTSPYVTPTAVVITDSSYTEAAEAL